MAVYVAANIALVLIVIGLIHRVAHRPFGDAFGTPAWLRRRFGHDDPADDTPERRMERHHLPEPTRTKTPNENAVDLLGSLKVMMPKDRGRRRS